MKELLESIPAVPKMYRHFAIITVVVTGCIALFADAENREAIAEEVHVQQQRAELRQADASIRGPVKYDPNRFVRSSGGGGFGAEGPVEPAGGDGAGAAIGIRSADGQGEIGSAQSHDMGMLSPETIYMRQGKLPPPTTGPLFKKPKQPSAEERTKLLRAAEDRAGAATPVI